MCGRYASTTSAAEIAAALGVEQVVAADLPPRYNVAPTNQVFAVATSRPRPSAAPDADPDSGPVEGEELGKGHRMLGTFRWGLVPSWAKDLKVGYKMINARSEGIADKSAFRRALVKRRCIIPVDAYYEWQARPGTKVKQPWAIHRADGSLMAMAGLWEVWRDPDDPDAEPVRSCTIVTTAANPALSVIHDRMPVILDPAGVDQWLDPDLTERERIEALLRPAPPEWFETYPVATLVNKVGTDGPDLLLAAPLLLPP